MSWIGIKIYTDKTSKQLGLYECEDKLRTPDAAIACANLLTAIAGGSVRGMIEIQTTDFSSTPFGVIVLNNCQAGDLINVGGYIFEAGVDFSIGLTDDDTAAQLAIMLNNHSNLPKGIFFDHPKTGVQITATTQVFGEQLECFLVGATGGISWAGAATSLIGGEGPENNTFEWTLKKPSGDIPVF